MIGPVEGHIPGSRRYQPVRQRLHAWRAQLVKAAVESVDPPAGNREAPIIDIGNDFRLSHVGAGLDDREDSASEIPGFERLDPDCQGPFVLGQQYEPVPIV